MPDRKRAMARALMSRRARFEAVMDEVYEPLQRFALRRCDPDAADDVVADALLVVWRRLDDVPADAVLPWCYRVAANCLANQRRSVRRTADLVARIGTLDLARIADDPSALPDPELHATLATLSDDERELLRLWAWEALAPREIALVLGISPNAVSIRLHRAKGHLADALRKDTSAAGHEACDEPEEVT